MKKILTYCVFVAFAVSNFASPAAKWPQTSAEKREFYYSLPGGSDEKLTHVSIEMVFYSGTKADDPKNRLFIVNGQAFRTVGELKAEILRLGARAQIYWVLHGIDVLPAPSVTADEIADLVTTCRKAKIWFCFDEGG